MQQSYLRTVQYARPQAAGTNEQAHSLHSIPPPEPPAVGLLSVWGLLSVGDQTAQQHIKRVGRLPRSQPLGTQPAGSCFPRGGNLQPGGENLRSEVVAEAGGGGGPRGAQRREARRRHGGEVLEYLVPRLQPYVLEAATVCNEVHGTYPTDLTYHLPPQAVGGPRHASSPTNPPYLLTSSSYLLGQ